MRRTLLTIHRWIGILASLYAILICASGAALVFRIDLQRWLHPHLLTSSGSGHSVSMTGILDGLEATHPQWRILGIDAPTTARDTYLAYVADELTFRSVLLDPTTGAVLGELPEQSFVRTLQELHFNLFSGRTGRTVNGVGALCLLCLSITGPVFWWRGSPSLGSNPTGAMLEPRPPAARRLHRTIGICSALMLAVVSLTALSFTFPRHFRAIVAAAFFLTNATPPSSAPAQVPQPRAPSWNSMIATAAGLEPDKYVARVVMPRHEHDTFQVLFATEHPTPAGSFSFATVHVDRYSGRALSRPARPGSAGDAILAWVGPVHFGGFGGTPTKMLWVVSGLAPLVLVVTGLISWWGHRARRPRY